MSDSDDDEPLDLKRVKSKQIVLVVPDPWPQDDRDTRSCDQIREQVTVDQPDPCELLPKSKFLLVDFWAGATERPKHINENEEKTLFGFKPDDKKRVMLERKHKYTLHEKPDDPNWKFDDLLSAEARYAARVRARIASTERSKLTYPRVFYRVDPSSAWKHIWDGDAFKEIRPNPPFMLNGRCLWQMEHPGNYPEYVWQNPEFERTLEAPDKYLRNMYKYWKRAFIKWGDWLKTMNVKVGDFENEKEYLEIRKRNKLLKPPKLPTWSKIEIKEHSLMDIATNPHLYPQYERFWKRIYNFDKPRKPIKRGFGAPNIIKAPMLLTQVPMTNIVLPMSTMGAIYLKRAKADNFELYLKLQPTGKYQVHDLVLSDNDEYTQYKVKYSNVSDDADRQTRFLMLFIVIHDVPFEAKTRWVVNARYAQGWYKFEIEVANQSIVSEYRRQRKIAQNLKQDTHVLNPKRLQKMMRKTIANALLSLVTDKGLLDKQELAAEQAEQAKQKYPDWDEPYRTRVLDSIEIELARANAAFDGEVITTDVKYKEAYAALVEVKKRDKLPPSDGVVEQDKKKDLIISHHEDAETVDEWLHNDAPLMSWDEKKRLIEGTLTYPQVITDNTRRLRAGHFDEAQREEFKAEEKLLDDRIDAMWDKAKESKFIGTKGFSMKGFKWDSLRSFKFALNEWFEKQKDPTIPMVAPIFSYNPTFEGGVEEARRIKHNLPNLVGNGFRHLAYLLCLKLVGYKDIPLEPDQQEVDCRIDAIYCSNFLTKKGLLKAVLEIQQNPDRTYRDECDLNKTHMMWSINKDRAKIEKKQDKSWLYKKRNNNAGIRKFLTEVYDYMKQGVKIDDRLLRAIIMDATKIDYKRGQNHINAQIMKRYNQAKLDQEMLDNLMKQVPKQPKRRYDDLYDRIIREMLYRRTSADPSFVRETFDAYVEKRAIPLMINTQAPSAAPHPAAPPYPPPPPAPVAPSAPVSSTQPAPAQASADFDIQRAELEYEKVKQFFNTADNLPPKGLTRAGLMWTEFPMVEGLWDWEPVGCRLLRYEHPLVLVFYKRGPRETREESTVIWHFGDDYENRLKYEFAESCGFGIPILQFLTIEAINEEGVKKLYWTGVHTPFKIELKPMDDDEVQNFIKEMQTFHFVHGQLSRAKPVTTIYNDQYVAFGFTNSYIFGGGIPDKWKTLDLDMYNGTNDKITRAARIEYEELVIVYDHEFRDDNKLWTLASIKYELQKLSSQEYEFIDICERYKERSLWIKYRDQFVGSLHPDDIALVLLTMFPNVRRSQTNNFIADMGGMSAKKQLSRLFDGLEPTMFLNCNTSSCSTLLKIDGNIVKRVRINTKQPWFKLTLDREFAMMGVAHRIGVGVKPISHNRVKYTPLMLVALFTMRYKDDIDATFWDLTMEAYDQTFESVMGCEQTDEQLHGFAMQINNLLNKLRKASFTHGQFIPRHLVLKYNHGEIKVALIDFSCSSNTFRDVTSIDEQRFMHTINEESKVDNLAGRNYAALMTKLQELGRTIPANIERDQATYDKRMGVVVLEQFKMWQKQTAHPGDEVIRIGQSGLETNFDEWMFLTKWISTYFENQKQS